jgi:DNA-binding transcriptional ArsR family regulator
MNDDYDQEKHIAKLKAQLKPLIEEWEKTHGISAADLVNMEFEPLRYVVDRYIVEGCSVLAAKPKIGKSWLMLLFGTQVADQGYDVLYYALEDNPRRLKGRLLKLLGSDPQPKGLEFKFKLSKLNVGGIDEITKWLDAHPKARMIVIDTLAAVRPAKGKNQASYDADYEALDALTRLANERRIAIIVVHHLRKAPSDDPFDNVSGTLGLTGKVDSVILLYKEGPTYVFEGKGRDIEEFRRSAVFDRETCKWQIGDNPALVGQSQERQRIISVLHNASDPLGPKDIAEQLSMTPANVRKLLGKLEERGVVERAAYGRYRYRPPDLLQ